MGIKEDLEAAKAAREAGPVTRLYDIVVGETLYQVDVRRLDGMDWAAVVAECPPTTASDTRIGYNVAQSALVACSKHSKLRDSAGKPIPAVVDEEGEIVPVDWEGIFSVISGSEVQGIASLWWAFNVNDPNRRVDALKKASADGSVTN